MIMRSGAAHRRNADRKFGSTAKIISLILLFAAVVGLQVEYDATRVTLPASLPGTFTPQMVRITDMGFHPAVASFLWANTMPTILDLFFRGHAEYFTDLAFLNAVDPKMSYPYAFSVLTLPIIPTSSYPNAVSQSFVIGREGLANADSDWRIPYYMAINYYLQLNDFKDAAHYFDIAAQTPGVPDYAARFALNFGVNQRERDRVRNLWITVYESTNDPATKARAAAYVARLNDLDYLDAASKAYKTRYGAYPTSTDVLVASGIIPSVPQDPFGFTFVIQNDGTAGINKTALPAYITSGQEPQFMPQ
jgi:hypothetical protein